jgi:hypothetical protein
MTRRLALTLAIPFALALLALATLTAHTSTRTTQDAPDPLPATAAAAAADPAAAAAAVCAAGPGTFVSALSPRVDLPSLPDLSRRAFAAERVAERAGRSLPQRMGLDVPSTIPSTCTR